MRKRNDWQYKLVIVVREDIRLSPGKMAAQVAHAAVSCAVRARSGDKKTFKQWMAEGQRKVVLKVEDLRLLEEIERAARNAGFIVERISDAGLTEIPPGTITCIGIGPAKEPEIDRITGELRLA